MARASSRLSALFLLFCFYHGCMPSIHVRSAVSLSLHLPFSHPSAILVFPGAASIGHSPPKAESSEAIPDRSKAYAKEVLPLWGNLTGGMAILTTNFSFQIIPYPSSSSCFAWTVPLPNVYGQNLGLLPFFPANTTTNWNGDHRYVSVEFNTFVNPESDAAAALSFNHSGSDRPAFSLYDKSIGINLTTDCRWFLTDFSQLSGPVPRRFVELRDEPKTRRLLPGRTYDRRATRKHHAGIRGKVTPAWLERAAVAGAALVGMICAVAGLVLCCIRINRPLQSTAATELEYDGEQIIREPDLRRGLGPRQFRYCELAAATDNFAEERKIGRGGFGPVYRGSLIDQDRQVAIKALSNEQSVQGLKEFQAEVTIMSQLRHRNIVRLVGWCGHRRELAIVYELMSGGSLDAHLYNPDRHLTWPQRYKIALQLGSALRYLHTECDQCVVHGDIKPANIMLDACGNAKLGDFGLARLVDHGAEPQTTQIVAGTVGYIDPEFVNSRRPSAESDVYSYGVVLLEIACGRGPTPSRRSGQAASASPALLLASVRDMYRRNVILEAADRTLDGEFDEMDMERLLVTGLWCAQQDPVQRPSVAQAVDVLRSEDVIKLPVFGTTAGSSREIRALEGQAYGDLSAESSAYLDDESTETAYLTTKETTDLFLEE